MKLYLSDLDGTLLRSDATLDSEAVYFLEDFSKDHLFSIATARSLYTTHWVLGDLKLKLPGIFYNGALVLDFETKEPVWVATLAEEATDIVEEAVREEGILPIVYSYDREKKQDFFHYLTEETPTAIDHFFEDRKDDPRNCKVDRFEDLFQGQVFLCSIHAEEAILLKLKRRLDGICQCLYYRDTYTKRPLLEILSPRATKGHAAKVLQEHVKAQELISFGDSYNDISLAQVSDSFYAVDNAVGELKQMADGVLASNDEGGVLQFLKEEYTP